MPQLVSFSAKRGRAMTIFLLACSRQGHIKANPHNVSHRLMSMYLGYWVQGLIHFCFKMCVFHFPHLTSFSNISVSFKSAVIR
jgi:hypothetical protein